VLERAVSLHGGAVRRLTTLRLLPGDPLPVVGGNVLVPPTAPSYGHGRLTLYDPLAAKDVWNLPYGPGALVARSEMPHLTAAVARDGKVHVYDLRRREELFKTAVEPEHLRNVAEVRLFQDRWH